jgi:uncharacterized protein YutE (UPF0331/DUF86 family)
MADGGSGTRVQGVDEEIKQKIFTYFFEDVHSYMGIKYDSQLHYEVAIEKTEDFIKKVFED